MASRIGLYLLNRKHSSSITLLTLRLPNPSGWKSRVVSFPFTLSKPSPCWLGLIHKAASKKTLHWEAWLLSPRIWASVFCGAGSPKWLCCHGRSCQVIHGPCRPMLLRVPIWGIVMGGNVPLKKTYTEALTPSISWCDLIWEEGLCRYS